jgi:hypothetical protein
MSMKNSNDTIRNRSHDLPVCSSVPQPQGHRVPIQRTTILVTTTKLRYWKLLLLPKGRFHSFYRPRRPLGRVGYSSTLLLDLVTRRGWRDFMPRPLSTPGKNPVPIVQEAGWAPGPVWTSAENLASTGIRSPDCPARSQSLYRLSYSVHTTS